MQDESRVGQAQRPGELPGGYQMGREGSGMGTEATRRSKVVFKEGDGGSKRSRAGCRKQEVSRSLMDVWIHPLKLTFSGTLNSAGVASRPRHTCSVSWVKISFLILLWTTRFKTQRSSYSFHLAA